MTERRKRVGRREDDDKPIVYVPDKPRRYRDVVMLFTIALVFVALALVIDKFSDLAEDITDSNAQIAKQQEKLEEALGTLAAVSKDVIKANVNGCVGQNEVRTILRRDKKFQIKQSHATDYSVFFPGVDPQTLHDAIHEQNVALHQQIRTDLKGRHCHQEYPGPGETTSSPPQQPHPPGGL